jgi:hypothetical protein
MKLSEQMKLLIDSTDGTTARPSLDQLRLWMHEVAKLEAVVGNVLASVKESPNGSVLYSKQDSWNMDAHIEITITAGDVFAAVAALKGVQK